MKPTKQQQQESEQERAYLLGFAEGSAFQTIAGAAAIQGRENFSDEATVCYLNGALDGKAKCLPTS